MNAKQASRIRKGVSFGLRYVENLRSTNPKTALRTFDYAHAVIGKDKLAWRAYERTAENGWKKWIDEPSSNAEIIQRIDIMMEILDEELLLIAENIK